MLSRVLSGYCLRYPRKPHASTLLDQGTWDLVAKKTFILKQGTTLCPLSSS